METSPSAAYFIDISTNQRIGNVHFKMAYLVAALGDVWLNSRFCSSLLTAVAST